MISLPTVINPPKNHLKSLKSWNSVGKYVLNYRPFLERQNDLLKYLNEKLDNDLTTFLKYPIYGDIFGKFIEERNENLSPTGRYIFDGIYIIDEINNFIGTIPDNIQIDILEKIKTLKLNPFFDTRSYNLYVMAPLNNFAIENNITSIDPLMFMSVKVHNVTKYIPIAQWK
jgi:hypothetical protein